MISLITGNPDKAAEVKAILGINNIERLDIDLPEIQEIDPHKIIAEKLHEARKHHDGEFMVEDTSLYLSCLNNLLPGPLIKWFEKGLGNEGIVNLIEKLNDNRAIATDLVGYMDRYGKIHYFEGKIYGKIVRPRGKGDYGWGPIFVPDGQEKTFAEMTSDEKNEISHRRQALERLKDYLESQK
jgi:non-canonical purine NTP pyrophosphatase (RdgB/HAM1 family)